MKRTTGIRLTAWLGILAVCLAVLMPGANALKNSLADNAHDIFLADICYGTSDDVSVAELASDAPGQPSSDHHANHAAECLYCGFFTHNLPLLHSVVLPVGSYGFVSRIALQHQQTSYYARPAFVPLSRAPPVLS